MKILIVIAILLNVYGVLASAHIFKSPPEFEERAHHNPHPRHKHHHNHHHHHNDNEVNELTVDDLADVLISLPGSLGTQAYKTFLLLGKFLPADTKAHKFFTSIPKAIRRKSKSEISHLRAVPQVQSSTNPIFMMQPAGYHMMPLPLHPMFSSSPLDYLTRVPCRHTKLIRVPLHTFDVQISATTRRFQPAQSAFDDSDASDYDNDNEDDDSGAYLKDLLDLLGDDDEDDDENASSEPSENKGSEEKADPENNIAVSNADKPTPSVDETPKENGEDPSAKTPEEESVKGPEEETPKAEVAGSPALPETENQPSPVEEPQAPALPTTENQPSPVEEPQAPALPTTENQPAAAEEVAPPKEEAASAEQQVAEPKEVEPDESVESTPVIDTPAKKNKKKKEPKKGKKSATEPEPEPEAADVQEPENAPAPDEDENSVDQVATPIQPKRGKKKRVKAKQN